MRIAGQGLLDHYVPAPYGHQLAEGFAHQFVGLVMLVPAFFMILLVGWILDHIFVEEVDDDGDRAARAAAAAAAGPGLGGGNPPEARGAAGAGGRQGGGVLRAPTG